MPKAKTFEDYDWSKINAYFQKKKSREATLRRYRSLTPYFFHRAVKEGLITLPHDWDCVKFGNAEHHPAKGVGCDIRDLLLDPKSEEFTYTQIAEQYAVSPEVIVYHANSLKLARRRWHPPEYYDRDWKAVQTYLDRSQNISQTARKFGVSGAVIRNRIDKGILTRPEGIGDPQFNPGRAGRRDA